MVDSCTNWVNLHFKFVLVFSVILCFWKFDQVSNVLRLPVFHVYNRVKSFTKFDGKATPQMMTPGSQRFTLRTARKFFLSSGRKLQITKPNQSRKIFRYFILSRFFFQYNKFIVHFTDKKNAVKNLQIMKCTIFPLHILYSQCVLTECIELCQTLLSVANLQLMNKYSLDFNV